MRPPRISLRIAIPTLLTGQGKIAIRPYPPEGANAARITEPERGLARQIHAGALLTHFKIRTAYTLLFEGPEITHGRAMMLCLECATRVGRGSSSRCPMCGKNARDGVVSVRPRHTPWS